MDSMYFEFAKNVKSRLYDEINGRVMFEIYKDIDAMVFKVSFKGFDYSYAVNNIWDRIYSGESTDAVVAEFLSGYKKAIRNAFFKNEEHKKRDQATKMGVLA